MNWLQRSLFIVAGLFLLLFAFGEATNGYSSDKWLALFEFLAAVGCFFLAASTRKESQGG